MNSAKKAEWVYVVKDEESGLHRLTDILKEGQEPTYQSKDYTSADRYLRSVRTSRAHNTTVAHPAVNRKGLRILSPIDTH